MARGMKLLQNLVVLVVLTSFPSLAVTGGHGVGVCSL